jgi:TRAP-type uncharacterized transport system substrate-binding protein
MLNIPNIGPFNAALRLVAMLGSLQATAALSAPPAAPSYDGGCTLRVATGPKGKIYEQLFENMNRVCGAEISLCAVPSEGGLQNLALLSANKADIGMAQVDTLEALKEGDLNMKQMQAVMPLHLNLLHVVALSSGSTVGRKAIAGYTVPGTGSKVVVRNFSDLKELTIAAVGSAQLMGRTLEAQLHYGMKFENVDGDAEALNLLSSGKVQAVFTTVGWPSPVISKLRGDTFMLVRYDLTPPAPYVLAKRNYQNLDALNHPFLATPNLLLANAYKPGGNYHQRVAGLQRCLGQHLDELREGNFHSAWREIDDPTQSYRVTPFESHAEAAPVAAHSAQRRK